MNKERKQNVRNIKRKYWVQIDAFNQTEMPNEINFRTKFTERHVAVKASRKH